MATVKQKMETASIMKTSLMEFNKDYNKAWDFGDNWTSQGTEFETYINDYFFPKLSESRVIIRELGNRFEFLAKERDFIGQYSEEYVVLDSVPINMNLSKSEELMLLRNYPKVATKLYGAGVVKKVKFTLNNNDVRLNFLTLRDAVNYAQAVYTKKISDINVNEEKEIKAMLVDYSLRVTKDVRSVSTYDELFDLLSEAILNIQNNSEKYNEADTASGGTIGRYTTNTSLDKLAILTTDSMKSRLLNSKLANTYQVAGLDLTDRIISFDDLGGTWKTTEDITISEAATISYFKTFGDYQIAIGDVIPKDSVFTFDVSKLTEFTDKVTEVKPATDYYAYIFDVDKTRYIRNTKGMLKDPFYNGEFDEVTYWLHYYSFKGVSPFYNNVRIGG